jgi:hypothetical protein
MTTCSQNGAVLEAYAPGIQEKAANPSRRAPVIQGKTLMGIVSVSDILFKRDFVENPKRLFIEDEIEIAREDARNICIAKGTTSPECAAAWDVAEELQAEAVHQRVKKRNRIHSSHTAKIILMPWNVEFMKIKSFSPKIVYEVL